jgi:carboxylesterase
MGGAIALLTASKHPVAGVSLVNPGLSFYDRRVRVIGVLKYFQQTTLPIQEEQPAAVATEDGDYSRTPLAAVHQLKKLFSATIRRLRRVEAPVQVFKSRVDTVVPPTSLALLRHRLGPRLVDVVDLPNSSHVATLDVDAGEIFARSSTFFLQQASPNTGSPNTGPAQSGVPQHQVGDHMSPLPDPSPFSSTFSGDGPRIGVVLSHGFTGSPHGLRAWAQSLADAGFAVRMPLLPGHGTSWQELARTRWAQWHGALDDAYRELDGQCDYVFAAGLSMGGALALRIAATRPVAGVLLVNPALVIDDPRAPLAGILKLLLKSTPAIANDILKPGMDEGAYPRTPVAAAHEMNKMFKDTIRLLPRITAPVLVFRSTVDHVVSDASIGALRRGLTHAARVELTSLENSYHVATLDNDADRIFRGSVEFILSLVPADIDSGGGTAHAATKQEGTANA